MDSGDPVHSSPGVVALFENLSLKTASARARYHSVVGCELEL
jgi:hypothetical protein